jgi:hypothetical protein
MKQLQTLIRKQKAAAREREKEMRGEDALMREQEAKLRKQVEIMLKVMAAELIKDKLITDINDFEIRFKKGKLFINGKKQSNGVYKKYKKLYEKARGVKIDDKSTFTIANRK